MGWTTDEDNSKKVKYFSEDNVITVQFCGRGLRIEVREIQEDRSELLMYKRFISGGELGLSFKK